MQQMCQFDPREADLKTIRLLTLDAGARLRKLRELIMAGQKRVSKCPDEKSTPVGRWN